MTITPEVRKAWNNYWGCGFSEKAFNRLAAICDCDVREAIAILSGSQDIQSSFSQTYIGHRTQIEMLGELK